MYFKTLTVCRTMMSPEKSKGSNMNVSGTGFDNNVFDEWIDTVPWLNVDMVTE